MLTDKERLEEIKNHLENTFIKLGRSSGKTQFVNDLNWLIKQAEKVETYEKTLNECIHQDGLMDFLDKNSWACQEDYFVELGSKALYGK